MRRRQLAGETFGRLKAREPHGQDKQGRLMWLCVCACGTRKRVPSRHLIQGRTRSCGCLKKENAAANGKKGAPRISGARSHFFDRTRTEADRVRHVLARRRLHAAVRAGDVAKPDACSGCGGSERGIQAHHEDYSRPLDVVWLCTTCHAQRHPFVRGKEWYVRALIAEGGDDGR